MSRRIRKISHEQAGQICAVIERVNMAIAGASGVVLQLSNPRFKELRQGKWFRVLFLKMADVLEEEAREIRRVLDDKSL